MANLPKTVVVQSARQFAFLQRLSMAHERCIRTFADLEEILICKEPIVHGWTIKDIIGHVITWNRQFRYAIQGILGQEKAQHSPLLQNGMDFDEWNEARIAEKRNWTWKRIRADLDQDYSEAVELILQGAFHLS
ncbi:MAG: DinB family protein [Chloroflexota bacterium]